MPHIHLHTTADLHENADVPEILEALTAEMAKQETVGSASIKAYHSLRSFWAVGEGHPASFAHCEVSILSGRPLELRKRMAEALVKVLREKLAYSVEQGEVSITLELREMDAETYQR